jgi:hypothetical protein
MSRIVIDPNELAALSALCRNASYDAAGIATEMRVRIDHVVSLLHAENAAADAARLEAAVQTALHQLHHVANELDADALGDLHGNDHALLARLQPGEDQQ